MKQHIYKFWFLLCAAMLSIGMTAQGQLIWTNGPAMTTPRGHHTATVLKDGCTRLQVGQVDMGTYERNADLSITPVTGLNTAGHQGGPFNPPAKMYTLINESEDEATWAVVKTQNWLDVSPTGGVLAVGANTNVTVAINRQANTLPVGVYTNVVLFSNVNTAVTQTRKVTLTVFTSPEIYVSYPSLDVTNALSQVTCRALTIGNSGDAPLHYTIRSWQTGYTPLEAPHDVAQSRIEGNSMVLEYAFGKPIVEKRGEYDSIRIEGLRDYLRVGAPILPVRPATLLVPYGKKVTGVRVMVVKGAKLEGLYRLPPAQPPYPLSRPDAVKAVPPNSAIYGKAVPWPGRYHEKLDTQSKRGYQLLTLSLLPLQYTPPTGQIEYVERLRVEVTLADMDAAAVLRVGGQGEPSIASRVDNPQTMRTYPSADRPSRSKTGSAMLPTGGPYQYVIITTPELAASSSPWNFQALCDARTAQGMSATIVTTDWIYAHYSGTRPDGSMDNQTRIRNFLIDAYQTWGTRYALLGGVSTLVPARFFWVDSTEMPVDMYYGCVEPAACTFDGDTDGLYGEPTDGVDGGDVDLEAEIYVGRAAVEDATELANFVRKTLTYQQTTLEYLPKITMLGEYLGFGGVSDYATEMMEQIRLGGTYDGYSTYGFENHARPDFVDFNTSNNLYDAPACDWPKANLIALMNAGTHVFNHLGHANQTYTMKLNNWDLSSLTNTDYFFVYSQGCMPGWFDSPDCFAEEITAMEHGAFAVVMNARYGWGRFDSTDGPSERFDRQYWDAVLGENMLELGRANQDSKEDNLWDINGSCIRWCYYELNLFGDPAQRFRFVDSAEWITTTPESGTVSPGASTNIEACFDAGELNPGVYQGEIALASDDLDTPSINMSCAMTVLPDDLRLSPSSDFSASGCQGGPFSPSNMVYQLTNMGRSNLTWTATCSSNWISLTPSGGTLAAGASEVITVRISSVANRLPVGVCGDRLTFSNGNNGVIQCRSVLLDVIPVPPTIVTIDFDEGFTTGAQTQDFLSAYGISSVTFSGAPGAMGPWIIDGTVGNTIPSSEPNALMQWLSATDPGQIHRLTFLFSPELKEFSLTRAGRFGGSSTDTWIARFFNSSNMELGSFGESTLLVDQPPKNFTFMAPSGETISRMDLESVYRAATTATVPVDDFVLVSKAAQTIDFPNPGPQSVTNQLGLSATASSGLPVSFAVESGPGTLADRTNLMFMGIGTVVIVASQAGDENWNPAPNVTNMILATEEDSDVINLALASRGSTITGSNGADWSNLIDGVTNGYTGDTGYGYTYWNITPPGTMTLDLKDSYTIACTKLLLWDLDDRYYQYKIEASLDSATWTTIVDRTAATNQCRSWQDISFSPAIQARYLRLTGAYNSANVQFHVVEWEVYGSPALTILTSADVITVPEGDMATFQVKLSTAPVDPTTVTVSRVSGDTDISVQLGGSLVFNYSNWSNYRTVTLGAAEDADWVNDTAVIRCSAPGLTDKDVTATEEDSDVINLALASRGSTITGSNGADWSNLIDGVTNGYTGDTGYGYTYWNITPPGTMTLDLKDSYTIACTKLLLWDLDDRYYQYKIEASLDSATWTTIVDRTAATNQCRSWQDISFSPAIQARYLRLTGTYNSANVQFHVVEWEVYGSPALTILTSADVVTVPEGDMATFQVKLNTALVSPATVTVSRVSGDADIVVQSDHSLEFDASNWSTYQIVTLSAADDADEVNGSATIRCSAPGITNKDVMAKEQDNDGVIPPNNLPIALSQTLGVPNDTITALTLMAEDQEGDNLSYRITSGPAHGKLDTNETPNVMYTPNPGYVGSDEFRFVANDGKLDSNEAIITLNVTSNSVLDIAYQQKLNRYAAATVRYFTSAQANNTNTSFTHTFYGIGPYQKKDDNGTWRTNDLLPRGYGSHVNMNEVTIRFLSLATAYKMNWLDHIAPTQRYARSWGAILTGLQTIRSMQTSGNVNQYVANTFHRVYQTTTYHNAPDQDRTVAETVCSSGVNEQSSDDNALPFANLLLLQGLASDPAVTTIVDCVTITNLCQQIRDAINLRRFLVDNHVVMNYINGLPNTNAIWDRVSVEGALILGAMLLQGQIGTNKSYGIDTSEFYATAPSLENHPVWWSNRLSGATTYVGKPSYHAAIYAHGLRAMHGMPVTAAEFTTNVNFFVTSLKPVTEAQIDYADGYDLKALGSQVMSQPLRGVPVFERNGVQVQFPGNESNHWTDLNDLAIATGPHAWFVPLQRWRYLNLDQLDIDYIFAWAGEYETNFFHVAGDPETQLGWEAAVPFKPDDTRYAWRASDGSWKYTDWGRPYEALNAGYSVLSIFDALNPDKPLSAYNIEDLRWGYIAQYLDKGVPLPAVLFPR